MRDPCGLPTADSLPFNTGERERYVLGAATYQRLVDAVKPNSD